MAKSLNVERLNNKIMNKEDIKKFEEAALPLIKYLAENHHPHTTVIVTSTHAELLEGKFVVKTEDYLVD